MEEQRNEGKCNGCNKGTCQNVGHTFSDGSGCPVREIAENWQKDQGSEVVTGHDNADKPLDIEDFLRITGFELGRGDPVHPSCKNICQKGRTPGIIYLPQQQNAEKGKSDQKCPLVVELQVHLF